MYVDDILLTGDDISEIAAFKSFLNFEFRVKDLGDIHYFLGLEIIRENGFLTNQQKFSLDFMQEFDFSHIPKVTSLDPSTKLTTDSDTHLSDPTMFRHLVGKLNYLTHTRPDLAFPVLKLCQFMQLPCRSHFSASLRVLRYFGIGSRSRDPPFF